MIRILVFVLLLAIACSAVAALQRRSASNYEGLYLKLLGCTSGPGDDDQFGELSQEVRHLFIAAIFDMEIQNGGICQFFANCGPNYAVQVSESLRVIGLEPMAQHYDAFLQTQNIDPADLSAFECDTLEEFTALYESYPESNAFDDAYMHLRRDLNFNKVMLKYAKVHLR